MGRIRLRRLLAVVLLVAGTYSVPAQNLSDRIAACLSCHGDDGQSYIVGTPSLAAEPALFVMIQLYLFREKQRQVEPMTQAAQRLSDDDLRSLSDMIAKLPPPKPPEEPVDAARIERAWSLVRKHHCLFCHNSDFSGHENVPWLSGQREDYLLKALRDFKSNTRPGYDASMAEVVQPISDAELADLAYLMARAR
jgi:cytochrome c553